MNFFSIIGYVSVVLWLLVPVLWLIYFKQRVGKTPARQGGLKRWLCLLAFGIALVAAILAKVNSVTYVNRIQLDQSAEIQAAQARQEAARKLAEKSRSGEVAQVRFAEDGAGDYLDEGGMDSADLKYMEKIRASDEPEWKKTKKTRAAGGKPDDSLEAQVGGKEEKKGVKPEPETEEKVIMMVASKKVVVDRLDNANLKLSRLLVLLGLLLVIYDYLWRANRYGEAFLPLPIPSAWVTAFTPLPALVEQPVPPRRTPLEELAWFTKRGDVFIYLTDDPFAAQKLPAQLPRLGKRGATMEVIHVKAGDTLISDEFIFEALWYGRASFAVDASERVEQLLENFLVMLADRKACRAKAAQSVHIVWHSQAPLPVRWQSDGLRLLQATNFSVFVCKG
jgi:hypothetical protein